ncbi:MAG: hypothetical protein ACRD11_02545 [Terriglobia bacterium]
MMQNLTWFKPEKNAARKAYDLAYGRECEAIVAKVKEMISIASDPRDIWKVHDYLSKRRRETDEKYDYRYSVLLLVFARLCSEGWLTESDLSGLGADKRLKIKQILEL